MIYRSGEDSIEAKTCKYVAKYISDGRDIDWLISRYHKIRKRYEDLVKRGRKSGTLNGELISDAVAEANAAVRVLASKGVRDKTVKEIR